MKQQIIIAPKRRLLDRVSPLALALILMGQAGIVRDGGKVVWAPNYDGSVREIIWASADRERETPDWVKQLPIFTLTTVFLTSGTSTNLPSDWNSGNNTVEGIGGGDGGSTGTAGGFLSNAQGGFGGTGGEYCKISNFMGTPGGSIPIAIGTGGASDAVGGDTTFNTNSLVAPGGSSSTTAVGTVKNAGGAGGSDVASQLGAGGGGGGAGGPHGAGSNGGNPSFSGSLIAGPGGAGDNGSGGAGGASGSGSGGTGTEFDASHGSGGGGGGTQTSASAGGAGGLYGGAGGGGFGSSGATSAGGPGAQGLLVLSYMPSAGSKPWFESGGAQSPTVPKRKAVGGSPA